MPVEIGNTLIVMAAFCFFLAIIVVLVVIGSKEDEIDPNGAEAYALEQLDAEDIDAEKLDLDQLEDDEFDALWEEEDEKE